MDQSTTFAKLLRVLQFRKHIKELTSACKQINQDGCYEFVTSKPERSKKRRKKSSYSLPTVDQSSLEHLSLTPAICPVNLSSMIISQSYKPLHAKSMQFNKNTIAVTKGTTVQVLYTISNWVFIEIPETGQTGFIPIFCLHSSESTRTASESPVRNNISLLNVSIYDKVHQSRPSIIHQPSANVSTLSEQPGRFISSIGPCYLQNQSIISTKTQTFTRPSRRDDSILSQQISNISLDTDDQETYGTLNRTPRTDPPTSVISRASNRLRVMENYQRQFVGDISVLESEVVTLVQTPEANDDWRLVRRGDGKQGFIPKQILTFDENIN